MIDFYIENCFNAAKVLIISLASVFFLSWVFGLEAAVLLCISYIIYKLNMPKKRQY